MGARLGVVLRGAAKADDAGERRPCYERDVRNADVRGRAGRRRRQNGQESGSTGRQGAHWMRLTGVCSAALHIAGQI